MSYKLRELNDTPWLSFRHHRGFESPQKKASARQEKAELCKISVKQKMF